MMRNLIVGLLVALLASPVFAVELGAEAVAALQNAGVSHDQMNEIQNALAGKESVTKEEMGQILKDAGLTKAQMTSIAGATPAVATAGATGTGLSTGLTIVAAVGLSVVFIASAAALQNAMADSSSGTVKP